MFTRFFVVLIIAVVAVFGPAVAAAQTGGTLQGRIIDD